MKVIIMRGLPGSGKSYHANNLLLEHTKGHTPAADYCSADTFFEDGEGNYNFNPALIGQAHNSCLRDFIQALRDKIPLVIVDNTCSQRWEYTHYVELADAFGYEVEVHEMLCQDMVDAKIYFERQSHGIPLEPFLQMWWRWEMHSPGMISSPVKHLTFKNEKYEKEE